MKDKVFSEFTVKNTAIKFHGDKEPATKVGCVGSIDESMNTKTITKKCEGIVVKTVTRGDGTGELKLSLHMRYDLFLKSYGMVSDGLKDGVYAYGKDSVHKAFCLTCEVYDEDDQEKLKAYPNVIVSGGIARKIENGAEEVAEMELTLAVMPDDLGYGVYETLVTEQIEDEFKNNWMTEFNAELVKIDTI